MAYDGTYLAQVRCNAPFSNTSWDYHTTDTPAVVGASGYISDAAFSDGTTSKHGKKGLRKGDLITVYHWSALPTDALVDMFSAPATAPTIAHVSKWLVKGIVAATGVADLEAAEELTGSATFDAGNLIDAAGVTTTVTVTGAALGDFVTGVSFGLDLQGIGVTAYVSAADTVAIRLQNETGGAIDLASTTVRVMVRRRGF